MSASSSRSGSQRAVASRNASRIAWSNGLQNVGDQAVSPKTVLPWLFGAAGVPHFFVGLLVPVRESLSMLPQAALTPWVTTQSSRKRVWLIGSTGQAVAAGLMALSALLFDGAGLGVAIIVLLATLALFRALCSIAGKDVMGRAIAKGGRGAVTGRATMLAGIATLILGAILALLPTPLPQWIAAAVIVLGTAGWVGATLIFSRVVEPTPDEKPQGLNPRWWEDTWKLFRRDKLFRDFVIVRSLMLVSALSTAFIVTLSQQAGADISGLGSFVLAAGLASLVGGRISGAWSDRSSKTVMSVAAGTASTVIMIIVLSSWLAPQWWNVLALPTGFFLVSLAHTAVRVARSTYIVDMADGDKRTQYTGAANTMMGVILLIVGAISSLVGMAGPHLALVFLAVVGVVGVFAARRLPDVSKT